VPEPGAEAETAPKPTAPAPSPRELAAAEELAAGIADPGLREAVARAAAASLVGAEERSADRSF
jgi:hypothetical protein